MPDQPDAPVFASATLTPTDVLAGDSHPFTIRLVIGAGYTPGPSRIVFDLPAMLGTSRPTLMHQEDSGFVEAYCTNPDVAWTKRLWDLDRQSFVTPEKPGSRMASRMIVLDLSGGLEAGDELTLVWGETRGGYGSGAKVSVVVPRPEHTVSIHVRYFADPEAGLPDLARSFDGYDRPEPDAVAELPYRIRPRPLDAWRLIRQWRRALLVPLDEYANVPEEVGEADLPTLDAGAGSANAWGAYEPASPAVHVRAKSHPVSDCPAMDDVHDGYHLFWGDVHTHSAFSNDCFEREKLPMTPDDLMGFARDRAGLDFYAVTDHHQPADPRRCHIDRRYWEPTVEAVARHHEPGRFVVFPGFEFRCPRGDTAVVLGWDATYDEIDRPEWTDVRRLWEGLAGRDYLAIPHFHNTGRLADGEWWACPDPRVEPVLEIFSCHGSYEREDVFESGRPMVKRFRPDRCGVWMLRQGHRYGLVANSDGHKGHVGSNGLTAVFARELTREALFEAYRERRVYGTTSARIRLVFTANGRLMGSALPDAAEKAFTVDVEAEGNLKKVELVRDGTLHTRYAPRGRRFQAELVVRDDGPACWYVRATQTDNEVAWSSPVWFE